jgi:hypothetical protein
MNSKYEVVSYVVPTDNTSSFNMQEFDVFDSGHRALVATNDLKHMDVSGVALAQGQNIIMSNGFQEIDIDTGAAIFE